jgi:hypothetical protein
MHHPAMEDSLASVAGHSQIQQGCPAPANLSSSILHLAFNIYESKLVAVEVCPALAKASVGNLLCNFLSF